VAKQGRRGHHAAMSDEKKNDSQVGTSDGPKTPEKQPENPLQKAAELIKKVPEIGGPPGPEPTRYGDWAYGGKVTDF
jgi:hypothetical protein